jgi:cell wall-associated NlpC family hydrolase
MTPEQYNVLEEKATAAVGHPDASCQIAMANIYKAAGLMAPEVAIPDGDRSWAQTQGRSLIAEWVDGSGLFESIDEIEPGALIGFKLGHTLHHVAIALSGGRMVHVFGVHGVQIAACIPHEWQKRVGRIWRIKA